MSRAVKFFKKQTVLCIAVLAALLSCIIIPPDREYLEYFDLKTLTCLFLTLAVICALRNIKFFTLVSEKVVLLTGNLRVLVLVLVWITFIGSMIIANDMALITFLPLSLFALQTTDNEEHMAYVFILQNISANLGGMVTPFGNPQNLYLYSYFNIPTGEFTAVMLPPFLLAVAMLTGACFFLPRRPLALRRRMEEKLNGRRAAVYLALFAFSILIVFRVVPYWIGLILIPAVLIPMDRSALKSVDYALLMTFVMFFIFAGNMSRMELVNRVLSALLRREPLLVSIASCQVISNVPTAILLSRFTADYRPLLLGVNIGGTGTLISSLASLITFSEYRILYPEQGKHYLLLFTLMNLIFLAVMTLFARFVLL